MGSRSKSSQATTYNMADNRSVYDLSDGGMFTGGDFWQEINSSVSTSTSYTDAKQYHSSTSTSISNSGNTSTTWNVTDGGAIKMAGDTAAGALRLADSMTRATQAGADKLAASAFSMAGSSQAMAFDSMNAALGAVSTAYEGARTDSKSLTTVALAALGVAGVVGVAIAWRKH